MKTPGPAIKTLGSDTMAPAFPEVIAALADANAGEVGSYGADPLTAQAEAAFRKLFGAPVEVRWASGGTGANVLALASVLLPGQTVLCTDTAHIVEHEAGAVSRTSGVQMRSVPAVNGKLSPTAIELLLNTRSDDHQSLPAVVSITQATELGTVYSVAEIVAIADATHAAGALLHVDGARIANAVVSVGASVEEMFTDTGVDVVSFGAIKGGTLFGEAVVWIQPELANGVKRKQISVAQLSAKTRFIAAQLLAYLDDDRWLKGARNANDMAQLLAKALAVVKGLAIDPVEANIVWATVAPESAESLRTGGYVWEDRARWVTAWDTTEEDVRAVVDSLR